MARGVAGQPGIRWLACGLLVIAVVHAEAATVVRVGLYENSPKIGMDADGKAHGIFADVLAAVAEREDWDVRYVPGSWQEGLDRLARGDIDLMPDVAFTAARAAEYRFHSEPVLLSWSQIYARPGLEIRSLPDLAGRRIATLHGSVQEQQFLWLARDFGMEVTLERQSDFDAAFRAVAAGTADAVVTNRYYGMANARASGLVDTGIVFSPVQLHFAAARSADPLLVEALDRGLRAMKADPGSAYYQSLRHWASDEAPPAWTAWLLWGAAVFLLLLLVSVGWSLVLRRTASRLRAADERQRRLLTELALARDEAEAADRTKSAFLATMSHELRTPLNSIIGFTGTLLEGYAGPLLPEQRKQMGMVNESARHLLSLINDVLDLSKIEARQMAVECQSFSLRETIRNVAGIIAPLADQKGLVLEVDVADDVDRIGGDQRRVRQVLMNLLGNAVKFTARGSIRASAVRQRVAGAEMVVITIEDTGIGIGADDLARLFEPFRQVRSRGAASVEGTGLGLAISRRLAELMGGTLDAASEVGKGSIFRFALPLTIDKEVRS